MEQPLNNQCNRQTDLSKTVYSQMFILQWTYKISYGQMKLQNDLFRQWQDFLTVQSKQRRKYDGKKKKRGKFEQTKDCS